ncbi:MAG: metallophosphoesterase family protein [Oscillospiraceae bacterium]|nr:metallophosphoesterase family protein [Oscillospiraceae bacterium]
MKILAVSDEEKPGLWDYYVPGKLDTYDLILSCGDLKADYLTFLVTMSRARLLYVHGNHDGSYASFPPEGCENIDGHLVIFNGVRILGLGGCLWYHDGPHQYTEKQMRRRIAGLSRSIKKAGGVDIVVTHAPPKGLGDMDSPAHRGFEALVSLIETYRPKYLIHGHTHLNYGVNIPRVTRYMETEIINASGMVELDYPAPADRAGELIRLTKERRRDKNHGFGQF